MDNPTNDEPIADVKRPEILLKPLELKELQSKKITPPNSRWIVRPHRRRSKCEMLTSCLITCTLVTVFVVIALDIFRQYVVLHYFDRLQAWWNDRYEYLKEFPDEWVFVAIIAVVLIWKVVKILRKVDRDLEAIIRTDKKLMEL